MYSAIFSESEFYECQVKRLILRANSLVELYSNKLFLPSLRDCNPSLLQELGSFKSILDNFENSKDLELVFESVQELQYKNSPTCEAW